jgi:hypothetical protein
MLRQNDSAAFPHAKRTIVITRGFKSMKKNFLYVGVAVVALGVMSGCATQRDLDAVRTTAETGPERGARRRHHRCRRQCRRGRGQARCDQRPEHRQSCRPGCQRGPGLLRREHGSHRADVPAFHVQVRTGSLQRKGRSLLRPFSLGTRLCEGGHCSASSVPLHRASVYWLATVTLRTGTSVGTPVAAAKIASARGQSISMSWPSAASRSRS